MIRVGQVLGAFGIEGAVKVLPLTDFDDRFEPGSKLWLEGASFSVEWSRVGPKGLVVKLRGLDDRTHAELHCGHYLEIAEAESRPLPAGSYYHHQLVGLRVTTASGEELGTISEVLERPANDVWIASSGPVEQLIPATHDAVIDVDLTGGTVTVADWLLRVEEA